MVHKRTVQVGSGGAESCPENESKEQEKAQLRAARFFPSTWPQLRGLRGDWVGLEGPRQLPSHAWAGMVNSWAIRVAAWASLNHGYLGTVRLLTWRHRAPRVRVSKDRKCKLPVLWGLKMGTVPLPLYSIGQHRPRAHRIQGEGTNAPTTHTFQWVWCR